MRDSRKERIAAKIEQKKKKRGESITKSEKTAEIETVSVKTITATVNDVAEIDADTLEEETAMPEPGESATVTNGEITTEIRLNDGKLKIKSTTKKKFVPIQKTVTEISHTTTSRSEKETEEKKEKINVLERVDVDSSRSTKTVSKAKEVDRSGFAVCGAIVFLIIAICVYIYRKYILKL